MSWAKHKEKLNPSISNPLIYYVSPKKNVVISYAKRVEAYNILSTMTEEERQEHFNGRSKILSISSHSLRRIWNEGQLGQLQEPRHGCQILPDKVFNEIFSDTVIRHCLGVSFSPRSLKVRIISEVEDDCLKMVLPWPQIVLFAIMLHYCKVLA